MLKQRVQDDMKAAMKAADKTKVGIIRLIQAAIKQREVYQRIELDDAQVVAVLDKMVKQRRDSIEQYTKAEREDLAEQERYEVGICQEYLPEALVEDELTALVDAAIATTSVTARKDVGKVMSQIKPKVQGRAVSKLVKQRLAG